MDTGEIISSKELYAKFMNLVESKKITWQFHGANRNQAANFNKEEDEVSMN